MTGIIADNQIKSENIVISAADKVPETAVLKAVRPVYQKDADGKRTDAIEAIRYDCVHPNEYWGFTIKVAGNRPVITAEVFEKMEDVVYLAIPVDAVQIKIYDFSYGVAKVSIQAPYVKIIKD